MDPFALQQEARAKTGRLVALAVFAIASVVFATAAVFSVAGWLVAGWASREFSSSCRPSEPLGYLDFIQSHPELVAAFFLAAVLIVVIGVLIKCDGLSSGEELMKQVGATRIVRAKLRDDGDDLSYLRLFNVCEEMAIASGTDMPSVWVLKRSLAVNAFVAGTDPSAAALCVTEGALRYLERDELQGVVAHEFSHILNGDMRLNFRLLVLIAGITAVSRLGKGMFTIFFSGGGNGEERHRIVWIFSGGGRRSGKGGKGGGCGWLILIYFATAALLWIVGSVGVFFARLVQCAVSRQRENLADASAAQFTRNPEGLANALRLSYLLGTKAESGLRTWKGDLAHMLFTEGERSMFATHPPVRDRILRLSPAGGLAADERLKARVKAVRAARAEQREQARRNAPEPASPVRAVKDGKVRLPPALLAKIRQPGAAGAVLTQLLRGRPPEQIGDSRAAKRALAFKCVTTIRDTESASVRRRWADTVEAIVQEDGEYDSFEFMVSAAVRRRLRPIPLRDIVSPRTLLGPTARVIATVASFGGDPSAGYAAAGKFLSLFGTDGLPPMPDPYDDALAFMQGLSELESLPPLAKRELLNGLSATVAQDGVVTDEEQDYVAAAADAIGALGWNASL